jgi:hypothetical protein
MVIMEVDSLQVIQALKDQGENFKPYGQIVDDAKLILGRMRSWTSRHVKRDANMAAHGLAQFGLSCHLEYVWMKEIPGCIQSIVTLEQFALII